MKTPTLHPTDIKKLKSVSKVKLVKSKSQKGVLPVTAVDVKYQIEGKAVRKVMADLGVNQATFSRACGFKTGARVSHIVTAERMEISGDALASIVAGIKKLGGDTSGLIQFVR